MKALVGLAVVAWALGAAEELPDIGDRVVVCPVEGEIDDGIAVVVDRAIREAEKAKALIFVIDTPGGRMDSAIKISNAILAAACPTIAYIKGTGAISAGALVAYSCQQIVMAPEANMGAATPVILTPEGMVPTDEKVVSFMRAKMRSVAEKNGHNPDIAQAMVDEDIELRAYVNPEGKVVVYASALGTSDVNEDSAGTNVVRNIVEKVLESMGQKVPSPAEREKRTEEGRAQAPMVFDDGSELVVAKGKLLTLTPKEALRYGVITATCRNLDEVIALAGFPGVHKHEIVIKWDERLFRWLTSPLVSGLLLLLGIGGLYVEIKTPGFGLPGTVGLACLALYFGARLVLGLSEWIDLVLVVVGIALIVVELFVLPGFGFVGVAGIACLAVGLFMSFTLDDFTWPTFPWQLERLKDAGITIMVAAGGMAALVYGFWKVFPHTPVYGRIVLQHAQAPDLGYVVQTEEQTEHAVGLKGIATSVLRPVGRGRFGSKTYQVVARAEFIEEGSPIVIIEADGNRYVVDRLKENG